MKRNIFLNENHETARLKLKIWQAGLLICPQRQITQAKRFTFKPYGLLLATTLYEIRLGDIEVKKCADY